MLLYEVFVDNEKFKQSTFLPNIKKIEINGEMWYAMEDKLIAKHRDVEGGVMLGFTYECLGTN